MSNAYSSPPDAAIRGVNVSAMDIDSSTLEEVRDSWQPDKRNVPIAAPYTASDLIKFMTTEVAAAFINIVIG